MENLDRGALLFTNTIWMKVSSSSLSWTPSLTTISMMRVSVEGLVSVLLYVICFSAVS